MTRALVAEHDLNWLRRICAALEEEAFEVHGCNTGGDAWTALQQAEAAGNKFDILITGYLPNDPNLNGIRLLIACTLEPRFGSLTRIFHGSVRPKVVQEHIEAHGAAYIQKDYDRGTVDALVRHVISACAPMRH